MQEAREKERVRVPPAPIGGQGENIIDSMDRDNGF
jgi:hypothetical protein